MAEIPENRISARISYELLKNSPEKEFEILGERQDFSVFCGGNPRHPIPDREAW